MATGCSPSLRTTAVKPNVARAVAANEAKGKPTDFWSLKLPKETQGYVPRLLAMRRLVADPEAHGLGFSRIPNQPYFARVETNGQIDLKVAADIAGITHEQLSELNPAFHRWATDPSGPHYLLLPSDVADLFKQNVDQLIAGAAPERDDLHREQGRHGLRDRAQVQHQASRSFASSTICRRALSRSAWICACRLRPPRCRRRSMLAAARVDGRRAAGSQRPSARARRASWRHAVGRGPPHRHGREHARNDERHAAWRHAARGPEAQAHCSRTERSSRAKLASSTSSGSDRPVTYVVRKGDTLSAIARLFQVTVAQIASWNDLTTQSRIKPGQKLTIRVSSRRG